MKHLLTVALVVFAGQAQALSCLRPDVARTFEWAAEAEESYVVLLGRFDFETPDLRSDRNLNPQEVRSAARFSGQSLSVEGFQDNVPLDVTIVFSCLASWCGSMDQNNSDVLAFVERTPEGYVLSVGPCFDTVFDRVDATQIARVEACMRGEACEHAPER